jgi:hypothetical protein
VGGARHSGVKVAIIRENVAQKLQVCQKRWRKSCNYLEKHGAKVASLKLFVYNNVVKRLK